MSLLAGSSNVFNKKPEDVESDEDDTFSLSSFTSWMDDDQLASYNASVTDVTAVSETNGTAVSQPTSSAVTTGTTITDLDDNKLLTAVDVMIDTDDDHMSVAGSEYSHVSVLVEHDEKDSGDALKEEDIGDAFEEGDVGDALEEQDEEEDDRNPKIEWNPDKAAMPPPPRPDKPLTREFYRKKGRLLPRTVTPFIFQPHGINKNYKHTKFGKVSRFAQGNVPNKFRGMKQIQLHKGALHGHSRDIYVSDRSNMLINCESLMQEEGRIHLLYNNAVHERNLAKEALDEAQRKFDEKLDIEKQLMRILRNLRKRVKRSNDRINDAQGDSEHLKPSIRRLWHVANKQYD